MVQRLLGKSARPVTLAPMRSIVFALILTACTAPNHLGNPLTLPVRGIANGISNATYDARRGRVTAHLQANAVAIRAEALSSPGAAITGLIQIARVPAPSQAHMVSDLAEISARPPPDWVERATVIAMVHGP